MSTSQAPRLLLFQELDALAEASPDGVGIVHGERRLTWREVQDESLRVARALLARGVGPGDNIAVWLPNHPEWLLLWLGAMRIGAVVVPVNTRYKPEEVAYVLRTSDATCLFLEESFLGTDHRAAFEQVCPGWGRQGSGRSDVLPELRHLVVLGAAEPGPDSYEVFLSGGAQVPGERVREAEAAVVPASPLLIVFTSGTTGHPKGVVHTHSAARMIDAVAEWFQLGPEDRVLGHLPLFHVGGVFSSFAVALLRGAAIVQMDRWDAGEALRLVEQEGITVLSGIPTHFVDLLDSPDLRRRDTSTLRTGWIGGSRIPAEVVRGAREVLGIAALLPVYGMTELTSSTTLGRPTDSDASVMLGRGVPLGGYDVAVVDPDSRRPLETGAEGEVAVRGYTVMQGYYKDPAATAAVLDAQGWFYTGDLGVFDDEGYLRITGRRTDMFIVGGNNVNPADVEKVLIGHPAVKQVHVCARPDERMGEVAVAFVEVAEGQTLTEQDVLEYATGRLASFKVPRAVVFLTAWPRTSTGKVQRSSLREIAAALP